MLSNLQAWLLSILVTTAAHTDAEVIQTTPAGRINWTQHTLQVTAGGAPGTKLTNLSAVRLDAERAAKAAVEVRLLDLVSDLPLIGHRTGAMALAQSPAAFSRMPKLLGAFHTVETRYFSDGGVDLVAQISLDSSVGELLVRGNIDPAVPAFEQLADAPPPKDNTIYTGLVVHGSGLGLVPVLAPVLCDSRGKTIYESAVVSLLALRTHGVVAYTKSLDAAMRDARVGDRPKVLRLSAIDDGGRWVADASEVADMSAVHAALRDGRVIAVVE